MMKETVTTDIQMKCPQCGHKFSPGSAMEHDLRLHMEKEFEAKFQAAMRDVEAASRQREEQKYRERLQAIEADREQKAKKLKELETKAIGMEEMSRKLKEREEMQELEMRKRMLEREKALKEEAERKALEKARLAFQEKMAAVKREQESLEIRQARLIQEEAQRVREEERMKAAEIQKKLDDQTRLVNEMKRKTEQGSMQAQGEVQELAIEDFLSANFVRDAVEEVSKGKRGGDCIHHVKDAYGNTCGRILYESKRTKNFGGDWAGKLREDMRLTQADIGVIVTDVLPAGMHQFGMFEGIWVCSFAEFKALAVLFRESLARVGEIRVAQENRGEKMQLLYHYLTSVEFRQKLEAIVEAFQQMQEDLAKEKANAMSHWAKREKQLFKVMENTVSLYGDVRGIAGNAVKEIEALEMDDVKVLLGR